jgi:FlaA1/EpsC-like NDP-sugar epimerase
MTAESIPPALAGSASSPVVDLGKGSGARWRQLPSRVLSGLRIHGPTWLLELVIVTVAFAAAFLVRYGGHVPSSYTGRRALLSAMLVIVAYTASVLFYRTYRIVWRFASVRDVIQLAITVTSAVLIVALVELLPFRADRPIPLSTLVIGGVLA